MFQQCSHGTKWVQRTKLVILPFLALAIGMALALTTALTPTMASASVSNSSVFTYTTHHTMNFIPTANMQQPPTPSQCLANYGLTCYSPALIRAAYNVPTSLTGAGQTIVIVDAYGSPTIDNDLHAFSQAFALADPTLKIIYPAGKPAFDASNGEMLGWAGETSLDVEWAHAIAPRATIDLVVAKNSESDTLDDAQQYVVNHHLGDVMSLSFGASEASIASGGNNSDVKQTDAVYHKAQKAGISVLASAGDSGATNGDSTISANFPASDPFVTTVGGTTLSLRDSGTYQHETVWNDSNPSLCLFSCQYGATGATGGAPSILFSSPAYQKPFSHNSARTTADVSYDASPYTGVLIYVGFFADAQQNGFYASGGTSIGAPQWAGITALADQAAGHTLGFLNPSLYAIGGDPATYATDFHDVTIGDNGFFGPGFPATTGYDLPTGLGTPNVAQLIKTLAHTDCQQGSHDGQHGSQDCQS